MARRALFGWVGVRCGVLFATATDRHTTPRTPQRVLWVTQLDTDHKIRTGSTARSSAHSSTRARWLPVGSVFVQVVVIIASGAWDSVSNVPASSTVRGRAHRKP